MGFFNFIFLLCFGQLNVDRLAFDGVRIHHIDDMCRIFGRNIDEAEIVEDVNTTYGMSGNPGFAGDCPNNIIGSDLVFSPQIQE